MLYPFIELRFKARLTAQEAASLLKKSVNTIKRYDRDGAPWTVISAISWYSGDAQGWDGYRFTKNSVITPYGDEIHKHVISNLDYMLYLAKSEGRSSKIKPSQTLKQRSIILPDTLDKSFKRPQIEVI
jgi:hypothetical protein